MSSRVVWGTGVAFTYRSENAIYCNQYILLNGLVWDLDALEPKVSTMREETVREQLAVVCAARHYVMGEAWVQKVLQLKLVSTCDGLKCSMLIVLKPIRWLPSVFPLPLAYDRKSRYTSRSFNSFCITRCSSTCFCIRIIVKVLELRHGVMMVGPSGSGKTSAWRCLLSALEALDNVKGEAHVIDPKAIGVYVIPAISKIN